MGKIYDEYKKLEQEYTQNLDINSEGVTCIIQVGSATCENAAGAVEIRKEFEKLIAASGRDDIIIKQTGCTGRCAREPIVGILFKDSIPCKYESVTVDKVQQIFTEHILGGQIVPSLILDKTSPSIYSHIIVLCSNNCDSEVEESWSKTFPEILKNNGLAPDSMKIFTGGSLGLCPVEQREYKMRMYIMPDQRAYHFDSEQELDSIIKTHFVEHKIAEKAIADLDFMTENFLSLYGDVAFFNKQTRLTLRNSGIIDPEKLGEYIVNKGYEALAKALDQGSPTEVIEEVLAAGLRGSWRRRLSHGEKMERRSYLQ